MSDEVAEFQQVLQSYTNPDDQIRKPAEEFLNNLCTQSPEQGIALSGQLIMRDEIPIEPVTLSFMVLNRCFNNCSSRWARFSLDNRNSIKSVLIRGILNSNLTIRNFASTTFANVVAADAKIFNETDSFAIIQLCLSNSDYSPENKTGFINLLAQLIEKNLIKINGPFYREFFEYFLSFFAMILANPTNFPKNIFEDVIKSHLIILPFYSELLNLPNLQSNKVAILDPVVKLIHETSEPQFLHLLYRFLFTFFEVYYITIPENMPKICDALTSTFAKQDPTLVYPSILFLQNVVSFEKQQQMREEETATFHNISSELAPMIFESLLGIMINNIMETPPDEGSGQFNLSYEIVSYFKDINDLKGLIFDWLTQNFDSMIESSEWKCRAAALALVYCISSGPNFDDQVSFLMPRFGVILGKCQDQSLAVIDTSLWIIEKIFRTYQPIVSNNEYFGQIIHIVRNAQTAPLILVIRVCDLVNCMGVCFRNSKDNPLNIEAFPTIASSMMTIIDRPDVPPSPALRHAYEALHQVIKSAPSSQENYLFVLLQAMCNRIGTVLTHFRLTAEQIPFFQIDPTVLPMPGTQETMDLIEFRVQSYCVIIFSIICRFTSDFISFADNVTPIILCLLESKSRVCFDEALIILNVIIQSTHEKIKPYVTRIMAIINLSLESKDVSIIDTCAIVMRTLFIKEGSFLAQQEFSQANEQIIQHLVAILQDQQCPEPTKIPILIALAEIVRSLKDSIQEFHPFYWDQLQHFQQLIIQTEDQNLERTNSFYEAILIGYKALIEIANLDELMRIAQGYKKCIVPLFDRLSKMRDKLKDPLKRAIIEYFRTIINRDFASRINTFLNRQAVISLLKTLAEDQQYSIQIQAASVQRAIQSL